MGETRALEGRAGWQTNVRRLGSAGLDLYPIVVALAVWQLVSSAGWLPAIALPSPIGTFRTFIQLISDGVLLREVVMTGGRILIAFLAALASAATLGIAIGRVRGLRLAASPLISFLFPTPKIALYPAMLAIIGYGASSKIALGFTLAFFQILVSTIAAASQVDQRLLWSAASLGTSRRRRFFRIVLPASVPGIMTGARIGMVGAIVGVFLGELIAGSDGLGQLMSRSRNFLDIEQIYVVLICVALLGIFFDRVLVATRAALLDWM